MKNMALTLSLILIFAVQGFSQKEKSSFLVLSYNVENLFDTEDDPLTDDDAFTPQGEKAWTRERYKKKLSDLSKVILSLPDKQLPALLALTEVENRKVLEDLASARGLRKGEYEIVHEESQDPRGIDCALLYRPDLFTYKGHQAIAIEDRVNPDYLHREILHVRGEGPDGKGLHIFVNHWKSRSGGQRETEKMRMFYAMSLRRELDHLLATESAPRVLILGDFNDEPTNRSLLSGLSASGKRKNMYLGDHYNLSYDQHNLENKGTYVYQGQWNMLDQAIVSYNLLNQEKGLSTTYEGLHILQEEWMLYDSEKYGERFPSATYGGPTYYGGPSDHLPLYVVFTY